MKQIFNYILFSLMNEFVSAFKSLLFRINNINYSIEMNYIVAMFLPIQLKTLASSTIQSDFTSRETKHNLDSLLLKVYDCNTMNQAR